jgi:hypothetical protein
MPKETIDYSNTIIYKIYCKNSNITDVYVGHTTNFTKRKYLHKSASNNLNNNLKIYNKIRENGGWENWEMIEIAKYNCKDNTEARIKEQQHFEELQASLNSCPPFVDNKKYYCDICKLQCANFVKYDAHLKCKKHTKNEHSELSCEKQKKSLPRFFCKKCHYSTSRKSSFDSHMLSSKHNKHINTNVLETTGNNNMQELCISKYSCKNCSKEFKNRSGLWKHHKVCVDEYSETDTKPFELTQEAFIQILKQNNEFQQMLIEQNKTIIELSKNNFITNSLL